MNHYTYLLVNPTTNMLYIGKRSCHCLPSEDTKYMSSSIYVPKEKCFKLILNTFSTSEEAVKHEVYLHNLFNVGINPYFYNKAKQTSTKFDTTGTLNPHSEETKLKISTIKKGKIPQWSETGKQTILQNLKKGQTPEARSKAALKIKESGSNSGIKNAGFKPWYIQTETTLYTFTDISKSELSVQEGHYNKYYADLQKKFNKLGKVTTKKYGLIIDMGFLS